MARGGVWWFLVATFCDTLVELSPNSHSGHTAGNHGFTDRATAMLHNDVWFDLFWLFDWFIGCVVNHLLQGYPKPQNTEVSSQ